jgi:hypothetical protein
MSIYRVNPISGTGGFKVHVTDDAGGLRVVGVFLTEADADAWIAADSSRSGGPNDVSVKAVQLRGP